MNVVGMFGNVHVPVPSKHPLVIRHSSRPASHHPCPIQVDARNEMNRQRAGHSIQILKNRASSVSCDQEDKFAFQSDKLINNMICIISDFLHAYITYHVDMMKSDGQEKCHFRVCRNEKAGNS